MATSATKFPEMTYTTPNVVIQIEIDISQIMRSESQDLRWKRRIRRHTGDNAQLMSTTSKPILKSQDEDNDITACEM